MHYGAKQIILKHQLTAQSPERISACAAPLGMHYGAKQIILKHQLTAQCAENIVHLDIHKTRPNNFIKRQLTAQCAENIRWYRFRT
jgi:hypothetical protein